MKYFIYNCDTDKFTSHETAELALIWVCNVPGGKHIIIKGERIGEIELRQAQGEAK